jgi:predicted transcriptional regulator
LFIKVSADGRVTLEDRDNFRAFKLVVEGCTATLDTIRHALAGVADLPDRDTAWIFEQALRQQPEVTQDAAWQANLGTMMEKAKPHGWIDEQRKAIKAHIEWTDAASSV